MKILVVGSGGREHALSKRLAQDSNVAQVFVYPGNPGMIGMPKVTVLGGEVSLEESLLIGKSKEIDLVVIGPEKYLFEGYVDALQEAGLSVYGPTKAASFLEESKIKSKKFMKEFGIPTAEFEIVNSLDAALLAIDFKVKWAGYVLKLSGPALGKGVIVASTAAEAKEAATQFFKHQPAGIEEGMVIEEKITGREVSLFYACSGSSFEFMASACDHKRLKDHDEGPNTGGMGAYSPCHWIDQAFLKRVEIEVVKPTLDGMISQGTPFTGTLFLGLMVNGSDYSLLEFNTRFGDPETQTFLPILKGNFSQLLLAASSGRLGDLPKVPIEPTSEVALHVVKASRGYPGLFGEKIELGKKLVIAHPQSILDQATIYFAGVKEEGGELVTSGGRVLGVTGVGSSLAQAKKHAYANLHEASFDGEQFRTDIGGSA
jgi:phosphoribosylamine--glycine ligase